MLEMVDAPTLPKFARRHGVPVRTMFRRLLSLHREDCRVVGQSFIPWMFRYPGGWWRVNEPRLRREHPEMFGVPSNTELDTRVKRVERQVEVVDAGFRALRDRVRRIDTIEKAANLGQVRPKGAPLI